MSKHRKALALIVGAAVWLAVMGAGIGLLALFTGGEDVPPLVAVIYAGPLSIGAMMLSFITYYKIEEADDD